MAPALVFWWGEQWCLRASCWSCSVVQLSHGPHRSNALTPETRGAYGCLPCPRAALHWQPAADSC